MLSYIPSNRFSIKYRLGSPIYQVTTVQCISWKWYMGGSMISPKRGEWVHNCSQHS